MTDTCKCCNRPTHNASGLCDGCECEAEENQECENPRPVIACLRAEVARLRRERDEARAAMGVLSHRIDELEVMLKGVVADRDRTRELGLKLADVANRWIRELDSLAKWQSDVAEGIGYLNRVDGLAGYEVADAETVVSAWRDLVRERDDATDERDALLEAARPITHGIVRRGVILPVNADEIEALRAAVAACQEKP